MNATVETTTGVMLSLEEFNALRKAEPYKRLMEDGWVDLHLICYEQSVRLTVSGKTMVWQVLDAAKILMRVPDWGPKTPVRNSDGVLLETSRRLEELGLTYSEKLFIG